MKALVAVCVFAVSAAQAAGVPSHSFFSGNDVYGWCQHDRHAAGSFANFAWHP